MNVVWARGTKGTSVGVLLKKTWAGDQKGLMGNLSSLLYRFCLGWFILTVHQLIAALGRFCTALTTQDLKDCPMWKINRVFVTPADVICLQDVNQNYFSFIWWDQNYYKQKWDITCSSENIILLDYYGNMTVFYHLHSLSILLWYPYRNPATNWRSGELTWSWGEKCVIISFFLIC